jgi:hypothetical protein
VLRTDQAPARPLIRQGFVASSRKLRERNTARIVADWGPLGFLVQPDRTTPGSERSPLLAITMGLSVACSWWPSSSEPWGGVRHATWFVG